MKYRNPWPIAANKLAYAQCTKFQMISFMKTETRTRGSHGFKYFIERTSNDVFEYSYFLRTVRERNSLPSDIVSAKSPFFKVYVEPLLTRRLV